MRVIRGGEIELSPYPIGFLVEREKEICFSNIINYLILMNVAKNNYNN